jgi:hypothetical protein
MLSTEAATMNSSATTYSVASSRLDKQPPAPRPLNESAASEPAAQRPYSWGPAVEIKTARFFTGRAWGPKHS